ncbi:cysteine and histidine-rich protein 1-like [Pocillopora damicornis]|nr:cysteine and histidine-rich protein 1-like [Pocillopora damicornis]
MSEEEAEGSIQVEDTSEKENIEPPLKKAKLRDDRKSDRLVKLEARLNDILSCTVCLDLPTKSVFQCRNGHLMCASCFTHLLADSRLKNEQSSCPNCRTEINRNICSRNLAVEKAISELPAECPYCNHELPRSHLKNHEEKECLNRPVCCKFKRIGCLWEGPFHKLRDHEDKCDHPNMTGMQLMESLEVIDRNHKDEQDLFQNILNLLSFEKIAINDLQLKPYRSDDFIPQLCYESSRFNALGQQWVVKATVVGNEKSVQRVLTYQLVQKGKVNLNVKFLMLRSPFSDLLIKPEVHQQEFTSDLQESSHHDLVLLDPMECNRMLDANTIKLRMIIFQIPSSEN